MPKQQDEPGQEEYDKYVEDVKGVLDLDAGLKAIIGDQDADSKDS